MGIPIDRVRDLLTKGRFKMPTNDILLWFVIPCELSARQCHTPHKAIMSAAFARWCVAHAPEALMIFLFLVTGSAFAHAQTTSLSFSTLPSAQGWNLVSNEAEANAFSVSGGVLSQRTVGQGGVNSWYERDNFADDLKPFTIEMTARILAEDMGSNFGLELEIGSLSQFFNFGIGMHQVLDPFGFSTAINLGTASHDYRLDGDFVTHNYTFSVDGSVLLTGHSGTLAKAGTNYFLFGDGTPTGSNANVDYTKFTFTQDPAMSTVPDAGSLALFLGGVIGAGALPIRNALLKMRRRT